MRNVQQFFKSLSVYVLRIIFLSMGENISLTWKQMLRNPMKTANIYVPFSREI